MGIASALLLLILVAATAPLNALPAIASASEAEQCGDNLIEEGEVIGLPVVLADQRVEMRGQVGDLFAFAQHAVVSGTVDDNAFFFNQSTRLSGQVGGDVFAFAQNLQIDGEVGGDIFCGGQELVISPGAVVHGNILIGCETLRIDGRVDGEIRGGGGTLILNGELGGGGRVSMGALQIGPSARLGGDLVYESPLEACVDSGAVLDGELIFEYHEASEPCEDEEEWAGGLPWGGFFKYFWGVIGGMILGSVLLAVGGRYTRRPSEILRGHPVKTLGAGFVVFVVTPIVALIAIVLILPMPLGITTLLLYVVGLLLAGLVVSLWLGSWLLRLLGRAAASPYLALALGLVVFNLLILMPYLGLLMKVLTMVAGLGGIFLTLARQGGEPLPELPA